MRKISLFVFTILLTAEISVQSQNIPEQASGNRPGVSRRVELPRKPPVVVWDYEFPQEIKDVALSPGARWIVVVETVKVDDSWDNLEGRVYLFQKNGRLEWVKNIDRPPVFVSIAANENVRGGVRVGVMAGGDTPGFGHFIMMDRKGDILWEVPGTHMNFSLSPDGEYVLISDDEAYSALLYDRDGNRVWRKSDEIVDEDSYGFGLTRPRVNGWPFVSGPIEVEEYDRVVVLYGMMAGSKGLVYNVAGDLLWSTSSEEWIENISRDGRYFLIGSEWTEDEVTPGGIQLSLYDLYQNRLFTLEHPEMFAVNTISDNGKTIKTSGRNPFYDNQGNQLPLRRRGIGVMSGNGKYYLDFDRPHLTFHNINSGETIWEFNLDEKGIETSGRRLNLTYDGRYIVARSQNKIWFIRNTGIGGDD